MADKGPDVSPPSLPSASNPTVVHITATETVPIAISVPSGPANKTSSTPTSPTSASASASGGNVSGGERQHTFYKPRATSTASARRSRAESLTNSLSGANANYPPSLTSRSRPHSLSRSRPPSTSYLPSQTTPTASSSLTHTGGILPPASFFYPKQPPVPTNAGINSPTDTRPPPLNANNVYAPPRMSGYNGGGYRAGGRPSSGISTGSSTTGGGGQIHTSTGIPLVSSTSSHAREHGLIMLPLSHIHSRNSDGSLSGPDLSSYSDSSQGRRRISAHGMTRVKPSREALLPIGEKDTLSAPTSGKASPHGGVRGSLEKIFRRTTSSEREREGPTPILKDKDISRSPIHDHARAASSLSARLQRHSSLAESKGGPKDNIKATELEPISDPKQSQDHVKTQPVMEILHEAPPAPVVAETVQEEEAIPHDAFEGVALDGQRFTYGPRKNWQEHPSQNTFFLGGRLLTGGDSPLAFLFSISVVLAIGGVWFGTTAVWWWKYESPAVALVGAYMCLLTISSMMATALRDPGILPRDLDIDPPYPSTPPIEGGPKVPLPRDLRVRSGAVRVKYCTTCKIYRPPRSSHCKLCDNCVEGCDHHCPWVNNCVGRRNYTAFFTFLFFANLTLLLVIVTSALHIWLLIRRHMVSTFPAALKEGRGSVAAFVMSVLVLGPVFALFAYHVRLMLLNITTIEQVRNQAHRSLIPGPLPANPFTLNRWYRNLGHLMCRPVTLSYIEATELIKHDHRLPNPGHNQPGMGDNGFENDGFDHHQYGDHDASMWKGEREIQMRELHINATDSTGMVNRSTWDHE
ncbi:Eukaryotic peptide chain release factor GTP-binding subunit [Serendipita sp. 400]|nr:Eukaryotic peptide chain release factor GTP-binding subunit [Serendipita sp. 400]